MNLNYFSDLMIFMKVVDTQSFTQTGKDCGVSKSVVSKSITRLEGELGTQLLHRNTRNIAVTEVGRTLYEHCCTLKETLDEAAQAVNVSHDEPRGKIRLSSPASFGHLHLAPAIAEFLPLHTGLEIEMRFGPRYENMIESGIDLAIHIGELPDSNYIARQLATRPMRVCASPSYLKTFGSPQKPEDLAAHNCLLYTDGPREWHFQCGDKTKKVEVSGSFASNSKQSLERAAVAGLGVAMLPGHMMTPDIKQNRLVSLLDKYCPEQVAINAIYPYTRHLAPKVRIFVDFLVERFQSESYWQ